MSAKKRFHVELYGADELLVSEWDFDTKAEQLAKYYELIAAGHKRDDVVKLTRQWFY